MKTFHKFYHLFKYYIYLRLIIYINLCELISIYEVSTLKRWWNFQCTFSISRDHVSCYKFGDFISLLVLVCSNSIFFQYELWTILELKYLPSILLPNLFKHWLCPYFPLFTVSFCSFSFLLQWHYNILLNFLKI